MPQESPATTLDIPVEPAAREVTFMATREDATQLDVILQVHLFNHTGSSHPSDNRMAHLLARIRDAIIAATPKPMPWHATFSRDALIAEVERLRASQTEHAPDAASTDE
jgi:hypothetical protein